MTKNAQDEIVAILSEFEPDEAYFLRFLIEMDKHESYFYRNLDTNGIYTNPLKKKLLLMNEED